MYGPMGFGYGLHALIFFALVVLWLAVVAGLLWALYFVVRTAVTRGILRADDIRSGVAPDPRRGRHVAATGPRQDEVRPEAPRADPTPPDVAA